TAVALRDAEIVFERAVRSVESVVQLVALEEVVVAPRLVAGSVLGIDGPAYAPDRALLALDPDDDRFRSACVVDSVDDPLGEAALRRFPPHDGKDTIARCSDSQACCARRSPFSSPARAPRSVSPRTSSENTAAAASSMRACSFQSQQTNDASSRTTLSSSRAVPLLAPTAHTSAPERSHSPRSTGSREVVIVTTTSCSAASRWLSAGSASTRLQNARRLRPVLQYATTRSIPGTAARMQATCASACPPQPITPRDCAPSRARYLAATALAAPVRRRPRWSASMTATSSGRSTANSATANAAPSAKPAYALTPA